MSTVANVQRQSILLRGTRAELRTELVRKSIHFLVALVPGIAAIWGVEAALFLLAAGTVTYTYAEYLRNRGIRVPVISRLTELAARQRDRGHFIIGPVTLGLGAMLALLLYPAEAASLAIYALAFGDGTASLIGKVFGRIRLPFLGGKTAEGSLACFASVFVAAFAVTGTLGIALVTATAATALEAVPVRDFDNLILPTGVGWAVVFFLF